MGVHERFYVAQARVELHLARPKPGEHEIFNAHDYSSIDFRSIIGQWQQVHPEGRSLVIVFADGAEIELTNFFGGAGNLIAQVDDATFVSPDLFLLKYSTVGSSTEPHAGESHVSSGADFVDPPAALPLVGSGPALGLLSGEDTGAIFPIDFLEFQPSISPLLIPLLPIPPAPPTVITGDTTGTVIEAGGVNNGTPGNPNSAGDLDASVGGNPADVWIPITAGSLGTFQMAADGTWTYILDNTNPTVEALNDGQSTTDTITVSTADGTTQTVTITVEGQNDAAVISGNTTGTVVEAGGVNNGTPGSPTATGDLDSTDVDNPADLWITTTGGSLGTFAMAADGTWTYTLDDTNPTVEALNVGDTATDTITVQTVDGTTETVTITVEGQNDAAVISGDTAGTVVEAGGVNNGAPGTPTATGDLDSTDVDNPADLWIATTGGSLGTFQMAADGTWTYTLDDDNATVEALNVGDTATDTITVQTVDGTTETVTITVEGQNDAAVISGTDAGAVVEAGGVDNGDPGTPNATGDLLAADVDNTPDLWTAVGSATASANGFGTFTMTDAGVWTYTLDNTNPAVEALNAGQMTTDTFTVTTIDGTSQVVTITIDGANDTPVAVDDFANLVSPLRRGGVGEIASAASVLANDSDVDAGQTELLRVTQVDGTSVDQTADVETPITGVYGTLFIKADGTYRYVLDSSDPDTIVLADGQVAIDNFAYVAANGAGAENEDSANLSVAVTGGEGPDIPIIVHDPNPYYAFAVDGTTPDFISANLTDLVSGGGQPLTYSLTFYSPTNPSAWSWLDQSAIPLLNASPAAITDANAGTYTALVSVDGHVVSGIAFTILGNNAQEFDITTDAQRLDGNRSIGDLVIVNDNVTGTVVAGGGDDVMWIRPGTGTHHLDGGPGSDALYGNAGNDILDGGGGNNFVSGGDGDDTIIGGANNDILLGGNGNDELMGGNGTNVLFGGDGNDVMTGGGNDDAMIGGTGNDTITFGGGSNNRAVYAESGSANVDTIIDYHATSNDVIDLSQLLDANFGPSSNVADFVRATQSGSDVIVQVDPDGAANGANFSDVTRLSGYGTANPDSVLVYFDGANHTLTA
jgi:VCBS repeat-containing protein